MLSLRTISILLPKPESQRTVAKKTRQEDKKKVWLRPLVNGHFTPKHDLSVRTLVKEQHFLTFLLQHPLCKAEYARILEY